VEAVHEVTAMEKHRMDDNAMDMEVRDATGMNKDWVPEGTRAPGAGMPDDARMPEAWVHARVRTAHVAARHLTAAPLHLGRGPGR